MATTLDAEFTYVLGTSLYVPLTSFSGPAMSLPASRGPNFTLPAHVVAALCRVRDAEQASLQEYCHCHTHGTEAEEGEDSKHSASASGIPGPAAGVVKWEPWCAWLDTQDGYFPLPAPSPQSTFANINNNNDNNNPNQDVAQDDMARQWKQFQSAEMDGVLRPTVPELMAEIRQQIHDDNNNNKKNNNDDVCSIQSIVIAGEGEPLQRLPSILRLLGELKNDKEGIMTTRTTTTTTTGTTTTAMKKMMMKSKSIRLVTSGVMPIEISSDVVAQLVEAGLETISVALQTHDPIEYNTTCLVQKCHGSSSSSSSSSAHDQVCAFVRACVQEGLHTETTAVERPTVDRIATETLSQALGVSNPIRWRPYYP